MNYLFVKYVQLTSLQGCNKKWSFHLPQLFFSPRGCFTSSSILGQYTMLYIPYCIYCDCRLRSLRDNREKVMFQKSQKLYSYTCNFCDQINHQKDFFLENHCLSSNGKRFEVLFTNQVFCTHAKVQIYKKITKINTVQ